MTDMAPHSWQPSGRFSEKSRVSSPSGLPSWSRPGAGRKKVVPERLLWALGASGGPGGRPCLPLCSSGPTTAHQDPVGEVGSGQVGKRAAPGLCGTSWRPAVWTPGPVASALLRSADCTGSRERLHLCSCCRTQAKRRAGSGPVGAVLARHPRAWACRHTHPCPASGLCSASHALCGMACKCATASVGALRVMQLLERTKEVLSLYNESQTITTRIPTWMILRAAKSRSLYLVHFRSAATT